MLQPGFRSVQPFETPFETRATSPAGSSTDSGKMGDARGFPGAEDLVARQDAPQERRSEDRLPRLKQKRERSKALAILFIL